MLVSHFICWSHTLFIFIFFQGSYSDATGSTRCTDCLANAFSDNKTRTTPCDACPQGRTSTTGSTSCTSCAAGKRVDANDECVLCPSGFFSTETDSKSCDLCGLGEFTTEGMSDCLGCDLGTFGSQPGFCLLCPAGKYQDGKGATNCNDCPVDTFLSEQGKASKADCRLCDKIRGTAGMTAVASSDMCLCKGSTVYETDGTSDGYYGGYNGKKCEKCEKGGRCDFDGAT